MPRMSSGSIEMPYSGTMYVQSTQIDLKRELRSLLALAIPVILSELGWMSMSIVDTIMVGRLSAEAIGAVGMGNAIYYAPAIFGIGILLGLDTLVSQAYGRGDFDECHRWLSQGVYVAIAFTPILMLLVWFAPLAFPYLGENPAVSQQTTDYLRTLNWGTLPLLLYAAFRRYLQGVKRVGPVTFALISANLINWAGNWALIYGHLGFPAHAHGWKAEMPINQRPVPRPVNKVRGDERESDWADALHSLQIAAKCGVEKQRKSAPVEGAQVVRRLLADRWILSQVRKCKRGE